MSATPRFGREPPRRSEVTGDELAGQELFCGVELAYIEPLLRDCAVKRLSAGDVLIEAGHANSALYLILEGQLGVHLEADEEPPVVTLGAGQSAGELSLIDGQPGSASVIARTDCRVLVIDEDLMWLLVNTSHAVSTNLLCVLARRLRHGNTLLTDERQQLRRYQFQATIDGLTELYNRHWLDKMLPRLMERAQRTGEPLSLLMVDIDHFKRVNDEHGHVMGDRVLKIMATRLRDNIRALDLAARYGGEEFAIICPDTPVRDALRLAERLRVAIAAEPFALDRETEVVVTVSVGAHQMAASSTGEAFLHGADEALYRAKDSGRNCVSE